MHTRRNSRARAAAMLVAAAVALCLCVSRPARAQTLGYERERGLAMLEEIKRDIKKNYYDPSFRGLDLDARFRAAAEKIKQVTEAGRIFGILAELLIELGDSHTFYIPPAPAVRVEYGWELQMIGDKCFITAVNPKSDAAAKGLAPGDEVRSVFGIAPTRENFWQIVYRHKVFRAATTVGLNVRKPSGETRLVFADAKVTPGKRVLDFRSMNSGADIATVIRNAEDEARLRRHRYYEVGAEAVIWRMPAFDLRDAQIDEMIDKARKRKSLILDLRGNGGGYETALLRLVGGLFDHDVKIGDLKRRQGSRPLVAKTRGASNVFAGRLVVLVDSESGSAAELLARVVQLEKRGTVLGDRTSGSVMRSQVFEHRSGVDLVFYYGVSVADADVLMTDGKSLERTGVTPDEVLLPTPADMAAGRDPVLSRAAELCGLNLPPDKAGAMFPVEWRN